MTASPHHVLFGLGGMPNTTRTRKGINAALKAHSAWETDGRHGRLADFRGLVAPGLDLTAASLIGANFQNAVLHGANFTDATLVRSCFWAADVTGSDFKEADLQNALMTGCVLTDSKLHKSAVQRANFTEAVASRVSFAYARCDGANFTRTVLKDADFTSAYLKDCNFRGAILTGAQFTKAVVQGANFYGAQLSGAVNLPRHLVETLTIVRDGDLEGWKKLRNGYVAKLGIPAHAKRSNGTTRTCRASEALVLAIYAPDGSEVGTAHASMAKPDFMYQKGAVVVPDAFDDDRWVDNTHGISFFVTRYEAEQFL